MLLFKFIQLISFNITNRLKHLQYCGFLLINVSSIWGRTKSYLRWIVRWIGPLRMTGSDASHVTGSDPVRKYVLRMRNRKWCHIRPNGNRNYSAILATLQITSYALGV